MSNVLFLSTSLLIIAAFCNFAKAACPPEKNEAWSYNTQLDNGPEYWGETYATCYGKRQSPINIVTSDVKADGNLKKLRLTNYDKPVTVSNIENNGHTVKVTPTDGVKRTVLVNGTTFLFDHLHFHWGDKYSRGSEHKVNDKQYALELHLVHFDDKRRIAVVGVFYQDSIFNSSGLSPIVTSMKRIPYRGDKVELKAQINLDKLVQNGCSFYRYNGSLTTPGCDEGVTWSICKEPINIGYLQLLEFRKLYSARKENDVDVSGCKITNNFRPIQPLNGRQIISST